MQKAVVAAVGQHPRRRFAMVAITGGGAADAAQQCAAALGLGSLTTIAPAVSGCFGPPHRAPAAPLLQPPPLGRSLRSGPAIVLGACTVIVCALRRRSRQERSRLVTITKGEAMAASDGDGGDEQRLAAAV